MQLRIDHKLGENDQFSARPYLFDDQEGSAGRRHHVPGFGTASNSTYQNLLFNGPYLLAELDQRSTTGLQPYPD